MMNITAYVKLSRLGLEPRQPTKKHAERQADKKNAFRKECLDPIPFWRETPVGIPNPRTMEMQIVDHSQDPHYYFLSYAEALVGYQSMIEGILGGLTVRLPGPPCSLEGVMVALIYYDGPRQYTDQEGDAARYTLSKYQGSLRSAENWLDRLLTRIYGTNRATNNAMVNTYGRGRMFRYFVQGRANLLVDYFVYRELLMRGFKEKAIVLTRMFGLACLDSKQCNIAYPIKQAMSFFEGGDYLNYLRAIKLYAAQYSTGHNHRSAL